MCTGQSLVPLGQHILVYSRNVWTECHKGLSWLPKGTQVCCFIFKDSLVKVKNQSFLTSRNYSRHDRRPAQMIEELLTDHKLKQKGTQKWKWGWAGQQRYRDTAPVGRDNQESQSSAGVETVRYKKGFFKYNGRKRKVKENMVYCLTM